MTAKEKILIALSSAPGPICDDCLVPLAQLTHRQNAYQSCPNLASRGLIGRGKGRCIRCGKQKNVSWNRSVTAPPQPFVAPAAAAASLAVDGRPWHWEGYIQAQIVNYLQSQGYEIQRTADTAARTHGRDIEARSPNGEALWISVKGYPESSPGVQARHWFAGALFDLVLYRHESSTAHLALGLPDGYTTYLNLARRSQWLQRTMPFAIYWISETGAVRVESIQ